MLSSDDTVAISLQTFSPPSGAEILPTSLSRATDYRRQVLQNVPLSQNDAALSSTMKCARLNYHICTFESKTEHIDADFLPVLAGNGARRHGQGTPAPARGEDDRAERKAGHHERHQREDAQPSLGGKVWPFRTPPVDIKLFNVPGIPQVHSNPSSDTLNTLQLDLRVLGLQFSA